MARLELSPEIYQLIVRDVTAHADLCALARVSRDFQRAAERALYNTMHMRDAPRTIALCNQLARTPRLAQCVEALTFFVCDEEEEGDDACSQYSRSTSSSAPSSSSDASMNGYTSHEPEPLPPEFWDAVAGALRAVHRLRFLNVYLGNVPSAAQAWILRGTHFQLHTLHCDLSWDADLAACLAAQSALRDLYIADYKSGGKCSAALADAIPKLAYLECAHTDAACALIPGRPVMRLKTCLSAPAEPGAREAELATLLHAAAQSTEQIRALDVADAAYDARFSLHLLGTLAKKSAAVRSHSTPRHTRAAYGRSLEATALRSASPASYSSSSRTRAGRVAPKYGGSCGNRVGTRSGAVLSATQDLRICGGI